MTVERPLRLRYQMTLEDKARFLDACPHLLDDIQAIDKGLGREPQRDWNGVWSHIEDLLHERKSRWKATEQKLFRSVFTQKDPEAEPVSKGGRLPAIASAKSGDDGYEPDSDLRDFENVPLKDDIDAYYEREVRPHVPDAWMDRSKDKVGYERIAREGFDRERAIFPETVLAFIRETQPREWTKLEALHGEKTGEQILGDLCK